MPKLTKTLVDNLKPAQSDVFVWDSEVPGFGVRAQPSGKKVYLIRYRNGARVQRKLNIGRACDMTPDQARNLARKKFSDISAGADPAKEKRDILQAPTMADLRDRYMKEHSIPFKKPRSQEIDAGIWRLYIMPHFGEKRRVADVEREDILRLQGKLSDKPATANQCVALLSKAFNLSELWGWRTGTNPCRHLKKYKINEKEIILTPNQIQRLSETLDEMVLEQDIPKAMADLIRLLMITGCRLNEIMSARQEWVDHDRKLLLLPDSKVGQRRIALSDAAMNVIRGIEKGTWLIPGRVHGEHLAHPYGMWKRIKQRAGLPKEFRHHDLRHTAGSLGHMAGLSQKQIATMLGHRQLSTTERYLHGYASDHAKAADTVGSMISKNWARPVVTRQ